MRYSVFVLAAFLLPGPAAAQPLDIDDDAAPVLETDDAADAPLRVEDLEDKLDADGPVLVEPKLDLSPADPSDVGNADNLSRDEPKPAPGLVIKIPTD